MPRSVTASGNSLKPFFLESVTFLTSKNMLMLFFVLIRKSILEFSPYLTSRLHSVILPSSLILPPMMASSTIRFALCVLTPTWPSLPFSTSSVYFNFLFGSSDFEIKALLPSFNKPIMEPVFGQ